MPPLSHRRARRATPPEALDDLARAPRPGRHLIASITVPAWKEAGFKEKPAGMEAAGQVERVDVTDPYPALPGAPEEASLQSRLHVYRAA